MARSKKLERGQVKLNFGPPPPPPPAPLPAPPSSPLEPSPLPLPGRSAPRSRKRPRSPSPSLPPSSHAEDTATLELTALVEATLQPYLKNDIVRREAALAVIAVLHRGCLIQNSSAALAEAEAESVDVTALVAARAFVDEQKEWPLTDTSDFSKAATELVELISPTVARNTLLRVSSGYERRIDKTEVPPATTNTKGCWLAGGTANKGGTGHVAVRPYIAPVGTRVANGTTHRPRRQPQFVHRLAVKAWLGWDATCRMYSGRTHNEVSHLCGEGRCFNPDHIVVESHSLNERRKHAAEAPCECDPPCIVG